MGTRNISRAGRKKRTRDKQKKKNTHKELNKHNV